MERMHLVRQMLGLEDIIEDGKWVRLKDRSSLVDKYCVQIEEVVACGYAHFLFNSTLLKTSHAVPVENSTQQE